MIKFFRQSYAIQYVVLALLAIALWLPSFRPGGGVTGMESAVTPIYNFVARLLRGSIAQHIVALVLLLGEALLFNIILTENQVTGKVGTMGAFVFIVLMSLTRTQIALYPFALSVPFILLVLGKLYGVYLAQKPEFDLFKAGIYIAFASMCYFPSIILVLWAMIALSIAKKGSLRLLLLPITGFLFVYFFYFSYVFLFGDFLPLIQGYGDWFDELSFTVRGFNLRIVILFSFLTLVPVLMFFGSGSSGFDKTIAVRTKLTMSIIMWIFSFVLLFLGGNVLFHGLIFVALTVVIAYVLSYLSNTGWADLFLAVFMLLVFANQYYFNWL